MLKGLQDEGSHVTFAPDQQTAVADAASADAVVVAVGEKAYAEGLGDNPAPQLTPDQQNLVSALAHTGKPVIVVVVAGRPLGLGPAEQANAVLMAYQGSTEAGRAVADVVFGKVNPSGKLPVTWPSDAAAPGGDFNGGAPSRTVPRRRPAATSMANRPRRGAPGRPGPAQTGITPATALRISKYLPA